MFHFPAFPPPPYTRSDDGGPAQPGPGSPIRTPPDQSSLANSPGHIAGRNVLHQLLVPRHPPNAPQNHTTKNTPDQPTTTTTAAAGHRATAPPTPAPRGTRNNRGRAQTTKMLATTIQITNNPPQPPATPTKKRGSPGRRARTQHNPHTTKKGGQGVESEPDSAPARPQHLQSPHAQPQERGRAPPENPAEPTRPQAPHHTHPTPPHQQAEKDTRTGRRDAAPQPQGSLERR